MSTLIILFSTTGTESRQRSIHRALFTNLSALRERPTKRQAARGNNSSSSSPSARESPRYQGCCSHLSGIRTSLSRGTNTSWIMSLSSPCKAVHSMGYRHVQPKINMASTRQMRPQATAGSEEQRLYQLYVSGLQHPCNGHFLWVLCICTRPSKRRPTT